MTVRTKRRVRRMEKLYKSAERCVPPGFSGRKETLNVLCCAVCFASAHFLGFLAEYISAHGDMYSTEGTHRVELKDAEFAAFGSMLTVGRICVVIVLVLLAWALCKYVSYHYTGGSRCIYTMKRISSRGEFYRRCCTIPLIGLALLVAGWILLTLLLGAVYVWATPERWLAPDAWEQVLRSKFFLI